MRKVFNISVMPIITPSGGGLIGAAPTTKMTVHVSGGPMGSVTH